MRIMHIKCTLNYALLGFGLMNLRICFLKALSDYEFRILLSSLFHPTIVDRKREFRKYSSLTLNNGILLWFLVIHVDKTLGIISKRYNGYSALSLKNKHIFRYNGCNFSDLIPNSW